MPKKKKKASLRTLLLSGISLWGRGGETQGNITTIVPLNNISSSHHLKAIKRSLLHSMISLWWTFYYTDSGLLKLPRKNPMVHMKRCLITKKPSCSLPVLAGLPQTTRKSRLGPGNPSPPSPQPLPTANPVPAFPGGHLAPAGSLRVAEQRCEHCCACTLGFAFILAAITRTYSLTKIGCFLPPAWRLGKAQTYF